MGCAYKGSVGFVLPGVPSRDFIENLTPKSLGNIVNTLESKYQDKIGSSSSQKILAASAYFGKGHRENTIIINPDTEDVIQQSVPNYELFQAPGSCGGGCGKLTQVQEDMRGIQNAMLGYANGSNNGLVAMLTAKNIDYEASEDIGDEANGKKVPGIIPGCCDFTYLVLLDSEDLDEIEIIANRFS